MLSHISGRLRDNLVISLSRLTGQGDLHERGSRANSGELHNPTKSISARAKLPQLVAFYACNCNILAPRLDSRSRRSACTSHRFAAQVYSRIWTKFWFMNSSNYLNSHIFGFNIEQFRRPRNLLGCRGEFLIKTALSLRNRPPTTPPYVTEINLQLIFSAFVLLKRLTPLHLLLVRPPFACTPKRNLSQNSTRDNCSFSNTWFILACDAVWGSAVCLPLYFCFSMLYKWY